MPSQKTESPAYREWVNEYLGVNFRDESCYDYAFQEAERLHFDGLVSTAELIDMIKRANASLLRLPS